MAPTPELTPYDTGDRLEAKPWIPYGTKVSEATPAENFGKVDFDDDASETVATIWIERLDNGTHAVHIQPLVDETELRIEQHPAV